MLGGLLHAHPLSRKDLTEIDLPPLVTDAAAARHDRRREDALEAITVLGNRFGLGRRVRIAVAFWLRLQLTRPFRVLTRGPTRSAAGAFIFVAWTVAVQQNRHVDHRGGVRGSFLGTLTTSGLLSGTAAMGTLRCRVLL